jgi:aspartyl-tRNA(Asn)/glutamyl-tRNA(Gln) amidotransferase subunit A
LGELGAEIVEVRLPYYQEMRAGLLATMLPEALAYHRDDLASRWSEYGASTRVNIAFGAFTSAADYVQAQRVRRVTQRRLLELLGTVDVIVTPTSPHPAPLSAEMATAMLTRLLKTSFTSYWNMTGLPALALPMGFTRDGLPLSLQIAGAPFAEAAVLEAGDAYQSVTDWHVQVPPLARAASVAA